MLSTFFQKKNVAQIEVTRKNKFVRRNWYILFHLVARTVKIYIPIHHTFIHNISKKVPKICEIVAYFEVTFANKIFSCKNYENWKNNI